MPVRSRRTRHGESTATAANATPFTNAPPQDLTVIDVRVGDGTEAQAGDNVNVQYTGVSWSNGQMFDSSWQRNMPFTFPLGDGRVIAGWDQGVAGMRVGGQRLLILPPQFAYGDRGTGPIAPGETLIFVVDLLSVN
jgi:peptidylprolyl isomerase